MTDININQCYYNLLSSSTIFEFFLSIFNFFKDNLENEDVKEEGVEEVVEKNAEDVVRTEYENISDKDNNDSIATLSADEAPQEEVVRWEASRNYSMGGADGFGRAAKDDLYPHLKRPRLLDDSYRQMQETRRLKGRAEDRRSQQNISNGFHRDNENAGLLTVDPTNSQMSAMSFQSAMHRPHSSDLEKLVSLPLQS